MNMPILARHHTVGTALWLYEYLREHAKQTEAEWMPVADGLWITDTQLAYRLDVTEATVRRWRKRLERLGYAYTELVRPRYRKFWLANPNALAKQQAQLQAPMSGLVN
jgi:hypothetical protein